MEISRRLALSQQRSCRLLALLDNFDFTIDQFSFRLSFGRKRIRGITEGILRRRDRENDRRRVFE